MFCARPHVMKPVVCKCKWRYRCHVECLEEIWLEHLERLKIFAIDCLVPFSSNLNFGVLSNEVIYFYFRLLICLWTNFQKTKIVNRYVPTRPFMVSHWFKYWNYWRFFHFPASKYWFTNMWGTGLKDLYIWYVNEFHSCK